jgi:hypothetical protein
VILYEALAETLSARPRSRFRPVGGGGGIECCGRYRSLRASSVCALGDRRWLGGEDNKIAAVGARLGGAERVVDRTGIVVACTNTQSRLGNRLAIKVIKNRGRPVARHAYISNQCRSGFMRTSRFIQVCEGSIFRPRQLGSKECIGRDIRSFEIKPERAKQEV